MESRTTGLSPADGRKFAFTLAGGFVLVGGVLFWRGRSELAFGSWILAGLLLLAGLLAPTRLGPVHRAWMRLAETLSRVTTPVVMSALYFLILAPMGLLLRRIGKISLEPRDQGSTYWTPREHRRSDLTRQF